MASFNQRSAILTYQWNAQVFYCHTCLCYSPGTIIAASLFPCLFFPHLFTLILNFSV